MAILYMISGFLSLFPPSRLAQINSFWHSIYQVAMLPVLKGVTHHVRKQLLFSISIVHLVSCYLQLHLIHPSSQDIGNRIKNRFSHGW